VKRVAVIFDAGSVGMRGFLLLSLLLDTVAWAQNWALLNPAYRYNYSNDGTDTISNQIRVMHVDTLGPDSFRYELNRVGVVCDTCPASLGGPCDGCYVRVDQPQFLGFECIRSGPDWCMNGVDTFLIRANAIVGTSWVFSAEDGILATVDSVWPSLTFDTPDTVARILIDNSDTVLMSRTFGILRFHVEDHNISLIGVEGAGAGRLFPDPLAYFDFQPGDVLIYQVTGTSFYADPGGTVMPHIQGHFWMVVITGRDETTDTLDYSTSVACSSTYIDYDHVPDWPVAHGHWSFNRTDVLIDHPILGAYPGQVLDTSMCWFGGSDRYIVEHGVTSQGRAWMRSQRIGGTLPYGAGFDSADEVASGIFPRSQDPVLVRYKERLGPLWLMHILSGGALQQRISLVGAIIEGDTIISPPQISWAVGLDEHEIDDRYVFPNPVADALTIEGLPHGDMRLVVQDAAGRMCKEAAMTGMGRVVLDVSDLRPGLYMLRTIPGSFGQRFMVVR